MNPVAESTLLDRAAVRLALQPLQDAKEVPPLVQSSLPWPRSLNCAAGDFFGAHG